MRTTGRLSIYISIYLSVYTYPTHLSIYLSRCDLTPPLSSTNPLLISRALLNTTEVTWDFTGCFLNIARYGLVGTSLLHSKGLDTLCNRFLCHFYRFRHKITYQL